MKRKTSSSQTRIYTYGCLPPIVGAEHVEDQLRRAHRYRNALVEIERKRREEIAAAQAAHASIGPLLHVIDHLETTIASARAEARVARSGKADRARIAELRESIQATAADLAVMRLLRTAAKRVARGDEALKAAYAAVQQRSYDAVKALRNGDAAPYWGTYLLIDKSAETWRKAADAPRFERYDGSGRIGVQIQGGMTVAEVMSGEDTQLRIGPGIARKTKRHPDGAPVRPEHRIVSIRVGSDGRAPIWATFPMTLHRELPDDGMIKWAWIIRKREGVRYRYELQITVEAESFGSPKHDGAGTVALDIGSRDLPSGQTRVAYWVGSDGARGEVLSPLNRLTSPASHGKGRRRLIVDAAGKVESLRSIRDRHLDEIKIAIVAHRKVAVGNAWYQERTAHAHQWRSPARVGALCRDWQRHEGDEHVYAAVKAYLDNDRHLLDWETNQRRRDLARRRDGYRVLAAQLARKYSTIVIAERDYRREERPPEDAPASEGHEGRKIMRNAAPGELRDALKQATAKYGARLIEVPIEGDTAWAVDPKVCERLLASAEVTGEMPTPLALDNANALKRLPALSRRRRLGTPERIDPLANEDVSPRRDVG